MTSEPTVKKYICDRNSLRIESGRSAAEALDLMESKNANALGIESFGKFSGIFTQSDFVRRVLRAHLNPSATSVGAVMTCNPVTVTVTCGIREAYAVMIRCKISHLPVIDGNMNFKGIVAEEDLREDLQDFMNKTSRDFKLLMGYIHGADYALCAQY